MENFIIQKLNAEAINGIVKKPKLFTIYYKKKKKNLKKIKLLYWSETWIKDCHLLHARTQLVHNWLPQPPIQCLYHNKKET